MIKTNGSRPYKVICLPEGWEAAFPKQKQNLANSDDDPHTVQATQSPDFPEETTTPRLKFFVKIEPRTNLNPVWSKLRVLDQGLTLNCTFTKKRSLLTN